MSSDNTVQVTIRGYDKKLTVKLGQSILDAALEQGIELDHACGGVCACSTCHVYVHPDWVAKLPERDDMEEDMLDFAFDVRPSSRLSCQIKVRDELDGLVVRVPERQA